MTCSSCAQRREMIKAAAVSTVQVVKEIVKTAENAGRRAIRGNYGKSR